MDDETNFTYWAIFTTISICLLFGFMAHSCATFHIDQNKTELIKACIVGEKDKKDPPNAEFCLKIIQYYTEEIKRGVPSK